MNNRTTPWAAPAPVALLLISEQMQQDLLALLDGQPQALQDYACQIVVDNLSRRVHT